MLLVKLGLVCIALAWGAFHHVFVRPFLDRAGVLLKLPRSLAGESAVGMAALLVAAVLVDSQPPPQGATPRETASNSEDLAGGARRGLTCFKLTGLCRWRDVPIAPGAPSLAALGRPVRAVA